MRAQFALLGWELIQENNAGISQQLVTKLATDEGLAMVRAITNMTSDIKKLEVVDVFHSTLSPFFKMISHPYVLSSAILEAPLDIVYTFLFGASGHRAINLFKATQNALKMLFEDGATSNENIESALTASLRVLQKIVDLNQRAQVIEKFRNIAMDIASIIPTEWPLHDARRALSRIQQRLNIDIPAMSLEVQDDLQHGVFNMNLDLPGKMSRDGQRHDNDHDNIAKIKVLPTTGEINSQRPEYLPPSYLQGGHLQGMAGLIDRQFRLFREDAIAPIRDIVRIEQDKLGNPCGTEHLGRRARHSIRYVTYENARVLGVKSDLKKGLLVIIEMDQPRAVANLLEKQRRMWWENSKLLCSDALVCLVSSEKRAIFFQVFTPFVRILDADKEETAHDTRDGRDGEFKYHRAAGLFKDKNRATVTLALVEPAEEDNVLWIIAHLRMHNANFSLIEFPSLVLPAFEPTLKALQVMSRSPESIPFADLLTWKPNDGPILLSPPQYARGKDFVFNLEAVAGGKQLIYKPGKGFDHKEMQKTTTLDEAQQISLIAALSRSFVLIQGPPGTGKSYTGVSIIKTLLTNREKANLGPIICVCYTNHALDQLLEHLVKGDVEQVVRIGTRSKSRIVQNLTLQNLARRMPQTRTEKFTKGKYYGYLESEQQRIVKFLKRLEYPRSWQNIQEYLRTYSCRYAELFESVIDEDGFEKEKMRPNKAVKRWIKGKGPDQLMNRPLNELSDIPLHEMSRRERKRLHEFWVEENSKILSNSLLHSLDERRKIKEKIDKCHQEVNIRCLEESHVIGVTTTGLAKNFDLLRRVTAKVLVCEEAGEVLEAQTITSLLPSIEHVILIGDHEQLRPQINTYELQHNSPTGRQFSFDVSLFERLVSPKIGNATLPFSTLRMQRRMHPLISELIRSTLYPQLEDSPSVHQYPEVCGMRDRLFWLHHMQKESGTDLTQESSFSKTNLFEVAMVNELVSHLVKQGVYAREDIAVITPYLGQLQKLKERLAKSFEIIMAEQDLNDLEAEGISLDMAPDEKVMRKAALVNAVRLATVDNFQGEEAKIIVISLVRSNAERQCGFLRTSNRINVLLSRAQHGMYIIGNADTASSVPMWAHVLSILGMENRIDSKLSLCCPRHPDTPIQVSTPDDFVTLSPEGGCNIKCQSRLKCGHKCINKCHSESLHDAVRCLERCVRQKAGCDHPCLRACGDPCEKECQVRVSGITLQCGHKPNSMACFQVQDPKRFCCMLKIETKVPGCGHKVRELCGNLPLSEEYRCFAVCGTPLPCGHTCTKPCNTCNPMSGDDEKRHGECKVKCGRIYRTCGHTCKTPCHGEYPCPLCEQPCEIHCAHSKCAKKCHEPCAPCAEECIWSCPHQGKCELPCSVPCDILPCSKRCSKRLKCGHQCPSICGEACPDSQYCQICASQKMKETIVDYIMGTTYMNINLDEDPCIVPLCGHIITMESLDAHQGMAEYYDMSEGAGSGKVIMGLKSSEPLSGSERKRCPVCRGHLNDIKRYNRILKRRWIDEVTKKFIGWAHKGFLPLAGRMRLIETVLQKNRKKGEPVEPPASLTLELKSTADKQIAKIAKLVRHDERYREILKLRRDIWQFLGAVHESEQPFHRIRILVEDVRRQRGVATELKGGPMLLQVRHRLLTTALLLRCDYGIICQFLNVSADEATTWKITVGFEANRKCCEQLVSESEIGVQPAIAVEGHIFWARFAALERGRNEDFNLLSQARRHLQRARVICEEFQAQTAGQVAEIEEVDTMLRESTFYLPVTNKERAEVYNAMALELRGTGHWYYCENRHPFTIGECGMPMEEARCPQCGAVVGGREHQVASGVTTAREFDDHFRNLSLEEQ
ncbi:hypothetical protein LOZ61_003787 [Ophidiomyces ophidiicola]|nr:hypothetical protein LOZ64_005548 [Ophidiomyces ophidiicola]KAI1911569.1 hypothetical protein LOZ61_003787 [Ophidiomyces ophidiicola]KAI1924614.1 hypothetical protein LOZ60_004610 [Ophidiomyces ophidiicola]KAI1958256.1 hypothetical protein LOZ59_003570 [Ophidiomyces ophidiicola]KAI2004388.1 hypothetical protein LOZ49_005874 [Ophidiomyces ophidiicola]